MELITIHCPLCGGGDERTWRMLNGYRIASCRSCGMRFVNPRPDEASILRAYMSESRGEPLSFADAYQGRGPVEDDHSWTGVHVLERFLRRKPSGTFLDIGAGQGWAVLEALKRGCDAYGYEFGDDRAFEKDMRLRDRMYADEETLKRSGKKFDLIYSSAVLEHVYDPVGFLKSWARYLNPGGYFCVAAVPNAGSWFIRANLDSWDGNMPLNHLNYFTPSTLRRAIASAGGSVAEVFTMGAPVHCGPSNLFRQRAFEKKHWGDHSSNWKFIHRSPHQPTAGPGQRWRLWATAAANHLLRWSGGGANLYATFRMRES